MPCGVDSGGCPLFKSVQNILNDKHPLAQPAFVDSLVKSDGIKAPVFDSVLFDGLTGSCFMEPRVQLVLPESLGVDCVHLLGRLHRFYVIP